MIRHKVYDYLEAGIVSPFNKLKEFLHSPFGIICKIRIYIVVIHNGIRASGVSFHHLFRGRSCMADDARIPHKRGTEPLDVFKGPGVY